MQQKKKRPGYTATAGADDVVCPFFLAHGQKEIICEACVRGARNILRFRSRAGKQRYMRDECEQQHCTCRLYLMMIELYDEREGAEE